MFCGSIVQMMTADTDNDSIVGDVDAVTNKRKHRSSIKVLRNPYNNYSALSRQSPLTGFDAESFMLLVSNTRHHRK
jgi:hypothetical protein